MSFSFSIFLGLCSERGAGSSRVESTNVKRSNRIAQVSVLCYFPVSNWPRVGPSSPHRLSCATAGRYSTVWIQETFSSFPSSSSSRNVLFIYRNYVYGEDKRETGKETLKCKSKRKCRGNERKELVSGNSGGNQRQLFFLFLRCFQSPIGSHFPLWGL